MKRINPIWLSGEESTYVSVVKKDGKIILVAPGGQIELSRREGDMLFGIAKDNIWQAY